LSILNEISNLLLDEKTLISIVTSIFTVVYVITAKNFLSRNAERRKDRQSKLWETLSTGFSNNSIGTVDDVVNIYKGINNLGGEDISYRAGLAKNLREYLVSVISSKELDEAEILRIKGNVTTIIEFIETENPYTDVPTAERNLILDVQKFIEHSDKDSAKEKLTDLAGLIEVRQDSLERVQASNKWSVPLAAIGLILTIIFGLISLFKT